MAAIKSADYIFRTELTEKQILTLQNLCITGRELIKEAENQNGFSISYLAELNHDFIKYANALIKEFRLKEKWCY